jgi:hypothetical protein
VRQCATGAKREQGGLVSGCREGAGQQAGLALGAAAPQMILHHEDFHSTIRPRWHRIAT